MAKCGVYKIQSIAKPEFCYIGSSTDLDVRINSHIAKLSHGNHENKNIQNHYNEYGENDLIYTILLECNKEELIKMEQFFMDAYNSTWNKRRASNTHTSNLLNKSQFRVFLSKIDKDNLKILQVKYEKSNCYKKIPEIAVDALRIGIKELLK